MINTALLIIDVQNSMFAVDNPVYDGEKLIRNIKSLLLRARNKNIPVYYIQHNGSCRQCFGEWNERMENSLRNLPICNRHPNSENDPGLIFAHRFR